MQRFICLGFIEVLLHALVALAQRFGQNGVEVETER